jgi:PTH1 family peptidyl-tRNA hydrolase
LDAGRLIEKLFPRGSGGAQTGPAWLVAGLGNPGPEYKDTRHNIGWWVLDELASRTTAKFRKAGDVAQIANADISGHAILLVRPITYVNRSGDAVRSLMRRHSVPPERLIVVYDDLNLDTARIRIRKQGGPGGHNGMKSIIASLGTEEFIRIRIGIGRPVASGGQSDYVLGKMRPEEREQVREAVKRAADAVETIISDGVDEAMTRFNA